MKTSTLTSIAWFFAAVIAGSVEYLTGMNQLFWIPYLIGAILLAHSSVQIQSPNRIRHSPGGWYFSSKLVCWLLVLWVVVGVLSSVAALSPLLQVVVAVKSYFLTWGIAMALVLGQWTERTLNRIWSSVVVVALLQWPFVLYQRLVVVSRRSDFAAWDAVVGTFGGSPDGGGNSPAMATVACVAAVILIVRWSARRIRGKAALLLAILSLGPAFLAEVKMIFIWLFGLLLVAVWLGLRTRPVKTIIASLVAVPALIAAVNLYAVFNYDAAIVSWEDVYEQQIRYAVDPDEFNENQQRLGRTAAFAFWWLQNQHEDPARMLLGHGLGASRTASSVQKGEVAARYPFEIDSSTGTRLLWDTGVVGTLAFSLFLILSAWSALSKTNWRRLDVPGQQSLAIAGFIFVLAVLGFSYNRDATDTPSIQVLLAVSLGVLLRQRKGPWQSLSSAAPVRVS